SGCRLGLCSGGFAGYVAIVFRSATPFAACCKEIGEADLRPRSGYADGADEQAHRAFLPREDVLDRRTDRRFTDIGVSGMAWHRRAFRLLAMDLRPQKTAGEEFLVFARAIGGVSPDIASGVVSVDQLRQQCAVVTGRICHHPAAD